MSLGMREHGIHVMSTGQPPVLMCGGMNILFLQVCDQGKG